MMWYDVMRCDVMWRCCCCGAAHWLLPEDPPVSGSSGDAVAGVPGTGKAAGVPGTGKAAGVAVTDAGKSRRRRFACCSSTLPSCRPSSKAAAMAVRTEADSAFWACVRGTCVSLRSD